MNLDLANSLTKLPSITQVRQQLQDDLFRGHSVLTLLSQTMPFDLIWQHSRTALWEKDLLIGEIDVTRSNVSLKPAQVLNEQLRLELLAPQSARALITSNLPEVIVIRGLEELSHAPRQKWLAFFGRWAEAAHSFASTDERRPPALWSLLTLHPKDELPQGSQGDTYLHLHWWWSLPSALEIKVLCRLEDGTRFPEPLGTWREALLPALAGNDLQLVELLWDGLDKKEELIWERLQTFADQQGWSKQKLEQWQVPSWIRQTSHHARQFRQEPRSEVQELWARGILNQTPEYGLRVSSAALVVLERWNLLEHRLWQGQATLLLPLIDKFRLSICQRLTRKYGHNWPMLWAPPKSKDEETAVKKTPLATEWGHLEQALRNCPYRNERIQLNTVRRARQIRNRLAHYRPISYQDYCFLLARLT